MHVVVDISDEIRVFGKLIIQLPPRYLVNCYLYSIFCVLSDCMQDELQADPNTSTRNNKV